MCVSQGNYQTFLTLLIAPAVYLSHTSRGCSHIGPDESTVYSKGQMKHSEANHWIKLQCESGRLHTCGSLDISTHHQLHGNSVWLDIRRETFTWQWVDGTQAGSHPFHRKNKHRKRHESNKRCALLHAGEGHIISWECLTKDPEALCQLPANKICKAGTSWCEEIKGSCFCVIESHHWYHARAACEDTGGNLSILPDESLRKDIAQVMKNRPPKLVINWLWIGLHGEDWIERSGPRKGQPAETALFVPEKESDGRKHCAVANTTGTAETWYAVSCHEKHKVLGICPKNQELKRADPTSHTSAAKGPKDHTLENKVLSSSASFTVGSAVVSSPTVFIILIGGLCQGIQK